MSITKKSKINRLPEIAKTLEMMSGKSVKVGALHGEHAFLAGIHEYGANIVPKKAQYLTVPVHHRAAGKKAKDFKDLWTLRAESGELFLCQDRGKDEFDVLFWLTKSVKIPERSFLRNGHDENADRIIQQTERMISLVLDGKKNVDDIYKTYGHQMSTAIKNYIRDLKDPPNKQSTINVKGSSNPLVDTGGLIESITYEVEG